MFSKITSDLENGKFGKKIIENLREKLSKLNQEMFQKEINFFGGKNNEFEKQNI